MNKKGKKIWVTENGIKILVPVEKLYRFTGDPRWRIKSSEGLKLLANK